ncbi:MAG TPA: hypothetical protein VFD37_00720, partial [Solirubrobacterales bacterium]|nr:hypothetical protein [Solirubrobacterales bacterium]
MRRYLMYRFSRSIYRSLAPLVRADCGRCETEARQELLRSCETTISRLVLDRRYFRNPPRSLFDQVRHLFSIDDQFRVRLVIERNLGFAATYLDRMPAEQSAMLGPHHCRALTRQGTPCRRSPLPQHEY